jgi:hypothetical protein
MIYQNIGAPDARRIAETLRQHGITAAACQRPKPSARRSSREVTLVAWLLPRGLPRQGVVNPGVYSV